MRRSAAAQGFQCSVEDRISNDQMTILMIFMPASAPVSNNNVRLVLSNCIANCKRTLLVVWDPCIGICKKNGLCHPEQMSCFLGGSSLHFAVLLYLDFFRSPLLSE